MPFRFETANDRWKWYRLSIGLDQPDPGWNWQQEMSQSEPAPDARNVQTPSVPEGDPDDIVEAYFREMVPHVNGMRQNASQSDVGGAMGRSISLLNTAYEEFKSGQGSSFGVTDWTQRLPLVKKDLQNVASGQFHPNAVNEALILIQYIDALIEISGSEKEPPLFGETSF